MTRTTKEEINGSPLFFFKKAQIIIAIVVILLTQLGIVFGAYYTMKADTVNHLTNKDVHMTYAEKTEKFVTRLEYDAMIERMTKALEDISEDVKYIRRNQ